MILYPAIDIYQGQSVRLEQGRFDKVKVYFKNPVDAAKRWVDQGAAWLHVVDLDGAQQGKPVNLKAVEEIMTSVNVPIQIGGGIRDQKTAETWLTLGAGRIVIGSAAHKNPDLLGELSKFKDRIAVGIDARQGKVAIEGWQQSAGEEALPFAKRLESFSPSCFIYTDIEKDGMMRGPNLSETKRMIEGLSTPIIASGGISSLDDLQKLKEIGANGAILGRSLYENKIDLKEALEKC